MREKGLAIVEVAGGIELHEALAFGQAGGKGAVNAAIADEACGFHEELHLRLNKGLGVTIAQGRTCHGQDTFKADDLRRPDDQRAGRRWR